VLVTLEGTRPLLVEIQALVDSGGPSPRRLSVGLDRDRLAMLLAVLHRHAGVACMDQDVFVNAVGGVRISEPAADLAVMLAIHLVAARQGRCRKGFFAFGEVGLAGEVRPRRAARSGCGGGQARLLGGRGAQGQRAEEADRGLTIHASSGSSRPSSWCATFDGCTARVANIAAMNPIIGWSLATILVVVAWYSYGWQGVLLSVSVVVFWLLLQFSRAMRAMRQAGQAPVGHVDSAVMLNAKLQPGMTMLQVIGLTSAASAASSTAATTIGPGATKAAAR
jgi:hypothetical protein